jgi:hypothetical protein
MHGATIKIIGIARFCTVVWLTEEPLRACMYDDACTQVSIDYVQDAHRYHLDGMCRDEYYLVLSNK